MKKYISCSEQETFDTAFNIGKELKAQDIICLTGDLGAGKTAFTKGIAKALGVEDYIVSPTFTIVNEYKTGTMPLYHFDVYRIADADELYEIGFDEYIDSDGVSVIEWADNVRDIIPNRAVWITISKQADGLTREIVVED